VPAAVGAALCYRWGRDALRSGDVVGISLAVVVLVLAAGTTAATAADVTYIRPTDRTSEEVLQWAQPDDDLQPSLEKVERVAEDNRGTDVLFWGTTQPSSEEELFYMGNESSDRQPPPGGGWYDRLPLPWYLERYDATTASTPPDADPATALQDPPPVVIAYEWDREEIAPHLKGYAAYQHQFKLWDEEIVIFVDESEVDRSRETGGSSARISSDPATVEAPV
jgi:predicted membrane-bound mannosyltransferase